jgi:GTP-binding protein HflX
LEEAVVADVLIHVIDSSSPEMENQMYVVENVLKDIGAGGKPELSVFNKCDVAGRPAVVRDGRRVYISAKTGENLDKLIEALADIAPGAKRRVKAVIPYSEGQLVSELHENQKVISEEYGADGTIMELMVDEQMFKKIHSYLTEQ